jgi:hypothetical protein
MRMHRAVPPRLRRPLVVAVAAAVVVAGAVWVAFAVTGGDRRPQANPPASAAPAASDPRARAVVDGYRGYWAALLKASDPVDPNNAELLRHVTGEELGRARTALAARKQAGEVVRGTYEHRETVRSIGGTTATLDDCLAARTAVYAGKTGKLKASDPPHAQPLTVTLQLDGGVWKVSLIKPGLPGSCAR